MLNNNKPNSYFYFGLCLSIDNMGLWASTITVAYCGPAVLKYLLLPEVHFPLSFRFQMRSWDILKVLRVVTLVLCVKKSQLMWLVLLVTMYPGCLPRGHLQPSGILQGHPSTYRRDYIPHIYIRITPSVLVEALVWGPGGWNNCL